MNTYDFKLKGEVPVYVSSEKRNDNEHHVIAEVKGNLIECGYWDTVYRQGSGTYIRYYEKHETKDRFLFINERLATKELFNNASIEIASFVLDSRNYYKRIADRL